MTSSSYRGPEHARTPDRGPVPVARAGRHARPPDARGDVYLQVQASPEFQEIRRRYRDFVFPMSALFLAWYLAYVLASTMARDLMAQRIVGEVNVALAFGLAQFASTFLFTWLYARNAGRKRDRAALDLRWDTQERFR
ncbi:DUF485 domain-containing protein [Yinghuangia soli]|uniref:DUF485 domain-containing protein n=1 Tax=Yinghuangia soli TaxID=2908204 RepID=A0AA41PVJ8_9ACTN|nr:DUF485 domain-containing protein [Yinghuangia soli]MCF2526402.1 DUF485 domain-containing protein [Yinghuangia soli]